MTDAPEKLRMGTLRTIRADSRPEELFTYGKQGPLEIWVQFDHLAVGVRIALGGATELADGLRCLARYIDEEVGLPMRSAIATFDSPIPIQPATEVVTTVHVEVRTPDE